MSTRITTTHPIGKQALQRFCPYCKALPGKPCKVAGSASRYIHPERTIENGRVKKPSEDGITRAIARSC